MVVPMSPSALDTVEWIITGAWILIGVVILVAFGNKHMEADTHPAAKHAA
jgi:APA family basic amino acid/polyamine antiporter